MDWKPSFTKGISSFRAAQFEDSLSHLNKAIQLGKDQYIIYDSRASVFEKLRRPKDALRDAKKVIDLAPDRWQGYARSARLFLQFNKLDAAVKMVDLALERVNDSDTKRRVEMEGLKSQIASSKSVLEETARRDASLAAYHAGKLPMEIFGEIFAIATDVDVSQAILISHVCRHWRAVALNTPSLWRTLVLRFKNLAEKTREWTKRSQGHIRELRLRPQFFDGDVDLRTALQIFPWGRLRICRLKDIPLITITNALASLSMLHVFSNLIELELGMTGLVIPQQLATCGVALSQLQALTIINSSFSCDDISTHKLVTLIIASSLIHQGRSLLDVLEANPMLETVVLNMPNTMGNISPIPPFSLSRLTVLDLSGMPGHSFCGISMPSLRILRLDYINGGVDSILQSLLDQERVVLNELRIQGSIFTTLKLVSLLEAASSLETFELTCVNGHADTVAEALAKGGSPLPRESTMTNNAVDRPPSYLNVICPSLKHITLSSCPDLKSGSIMRLVKSRLPREVPQLQLNANSATATDSTIPTMAQIETLVMDKCPGIEPEILPWLRSKVRSVSCVYASRKAAQWKR